jgi:hypothetical protein
LGLLLPSLALIALLAAPVRAQDGSGVTSPGPGAAINGDVPIYGTATTEPFQKYELHYKLEPSGDDAYIYFAGGTAPVINGQLGVWQAGALPAGTYTIRLRVVRPDGNYQEFYTPNISVNQAAAPAAAITQTLTETPTATPTFTPAPQPTAVVGQVTQPQVEDDAAAPTATPMPPAAVDPNAPAVTAAAADIAAGGALLPTATPLGAQAAAGDGNLTDQLGAELGFERLRTQFLNGIRISAALFIGLAALFAGKRLFEWVWKKYG